MTENNNFEALLAGLQQVIAHLNRLTNTRKNPGQHEQVRSEFQMRGILVLSEFCIL